MHRATNLRACDASLVLPVHEGADSHAQLLLAVALYMKDFNSMTLIVPCMTLADSAKSHPFDRLMLDHKHSTLGALRTV